MKAEEHNLKLRTKLLIKKTGIFLPNPKLRKANPSTLSIFGF